jgi:hypothetical protein
MRSPIHGSVGFVVANIARPPGDEDRLAPIPRADIAAFREELSERRPAIEPPRPS